jgi:nucleotide-binding universal stress UspA family protein
MTYKTLMLHVDGRPGSAHVVEAAAAAARRFDATLMGVGAIPLEAYVEALAPHGESPIERLEYDITRHFAAAQRQFRKAIGDVSALWLAEPGFPDEVVAARACAADLLVAARPADGSDLRFTVKPGDLLMSVGLPVLVVPPNRRSMDAEAVVIGWKRTREAERAISAALPFLRRAQDVVLVCVPEQGEAAPQVEVDAVLGRLRRHGVPARPLDAPDDEGGAGAVLLEVAHRVGADLIVCGAYGHSRALEWVFGGVTQHLLGHARQFVLFSR